MVAWPDHHNTLTTIGALCAAVITEFDGGLLKQKESDAAEAKRIEEEAKRQVELEHLEAKRVEKEKLDRIQKMAEDRQAIEAAKRDLKAKERALHEAENQAQADKAADHLDDEIDNDGDEDDDNDEGSDSAGDVKPVSSFITHFIPCIIRLCYYRVIASGTPGIPRRRPINSFRR